MKKFKQYIKENYKLQLIESSLSRVWQHSIESNIAILSACRNAGSLDPKIRQSNDRNTKMLAGYIRSAGFGFIPVHGSFPENQGTPEERRVYEQSFMVFSDSDDSNALKKFAIQMGIKFDQDSILYKPANGKASLVGTTHRTGASPSFGAEFNLGTWHPNSLSDYFTKMKGNRKFTFESIELDNVELT